MMGPHGQVIIDKSIVIATSRKRRLSLDIVKLSHILTFMRHKV
jgi:hypothetical protein